MQQRVLACNGLLLLLGLLCVANLVDSQTCVLPSVNTITTEGCDHCRYNLCIQYNKKTEDCSDGSCQNNTLTPFCTFREACCKPDTKISLVANKIHYVNIPAYWEDVSQVVWSGGPTASNLDKGTYYDTTFNKNVFDTPTSLRLFGIASVDLGDNALSGISMSRVLDAVMFSNTNLTAVPKQIKYMTKLTWLDLSLNSIEKIVEGELPSTLQTLNLFGNTFSSIPSAIFGLKILTELHLDACGLKDLHLTADQYKFLVDVPTLTADFTVTQCRDGFHKESMRKFEVCVENPTPKPDPHPNPTFLQEWWWVLLIGVVAVIVLVVIGIVCIIRRRHKDDDTSSSYKGTVREDLSASLMRMTGQDIYDIWDDDVMRKARIDYNALKLIKIIAHGNFGQVWLGTLENRNVVIKKLRNDKRETQYLNAFVDEIKLMATLDHPQIVTFIGVAWHNVETLMAVTEYMDGGDLCSFLSTPASLKCTWDHNKGAIAGDVAEALVYLHSFNPKIIHRDLKSRNIMLNHDLNAKLADFGISRQQDRDNTMTACTGTVRWMAPEVVAGERYSEAADIYSFGVVLTELDTHKLPFHDVKNDRGEVISDMEIVQLVASGTRQPSFSPTCPENIFELGVRCLHPDPRARPTSAEVSYALRNGMRRQSQFGQQSIRL